MEKTQRADLLANIESESLIGRLVEPVLCPGAVGQITAVVICPTGRMVEASFLSEGGVVTNIRCYTFQLNLVDEP